MISFLKNQFHLPQRLHSVYITYWSLEDPLCRSQSLPYILGLAKEGYQIGLVSFEQDRYRLSAVELKKKRVELQRQGVWWFPLRYHKSPKVISTLFDITVGSLATSALIKISRATIVHGRATVPCAIATASAAVTGAKLFADSDGPLSEEYLDSGVWSQGSIGYRLTSWGERLAMKRADALAVLSAHRAQEVAPHVRLTKIHVLPCAVDTERVEEKPRQNEVLRKQLGLIGVVFIYVGKFGGWYDMKAMFGFVSEFGQTVGDCSLLVVTRESPESYEIIAQEFGVRVAVHSAAFEEVGKYLGAADVGLCFLTPHRSKNACSPIKVGEYLASGLPVVISSVCGDYPQIVSQENIGVVVEGTQPKTFRDKARQLERLLRKDDDISTRCRFAALKYVGLETVVMPAYREIYATLISNEEVA